MTAAPIAVSDLTMRFGAVTALDSLTMEIPTGVTGLVGANGAGKTTLMRILLGLQVPTSGKVLVQGHDVATDVLAVRRRVGYMPEGDCLPPDVVAADFVAHTARLAGLPSRAARLRASETLFLVGLEEERFRPIGDFSTGMTQRVKLAQAIVHDPDLVLLDEPASGLDPQGRNEMLALVRRLGDFDINVVISSHVLSDISSTASWVVLLDAGRLLRSGPTRPTEATGIIEVEVLTRTDEVADALRAKGIGVHGQAGRLLVGPGGVELESAVVAVIADLDAGLVRLVRRVTTLEDEFLHADASRRESQPAPAHVGPASTPPVQSPGPPTAQAVVSPSVGTSAQRTSPPPPPATT